MGRTTVALIIALVALPTPLMGFGAFLGVLLQGLAMLLAVRTLSMQPPEPLLVRRMAGGVLLLIALPWLLLPVVLLSHR